MFLGICLHHNQKYFHPVSDMVVLEKRILVHHSSTVSIIEKNNYFLKLEGVSSAQGIMQRDFTLFQIDPESSPGHTSLYLGT